MNIHLISGTLVAPASAATLFHLPSFPTRVHAVYFRIVTDATVANRLAAVQFYSHGMTVAQVHAAAYQTASLTVNYSASVEVNAGADPGGTRVSMQLPYIIMPENSIVAVTLDAAVAGDTIAEALCLAVQV